MIKGVEIIKTVKYAALLFTAVFIFGSLCICSANAAELPSFIIAVPGAPDDLELAVIHGELTVSLKKEKRLGESSFAFLNSYFFIFENIEYSELLLSVKTGGIEKRLLLKDFTQTYRGYMTLDLNSMRITEDKSPLRSVILVGLRVSLTIIIEGIVFFLMGFRSKRSWIIFVCVNLITQGALNLWINSSMSVFNGYNLIGLIVMEIFIATAELLAFNILLEEKTKVRRVLYVLSANFFSLIAGGWLITFLPI